MDTFRADSRLVTLSIAPSQRWGRTDDTEPPTSTQPLATRVDTTVRQRYTAPMRIVNVSFDEDEKPNEVAFTMSVEEAALLYALVGRVAPSQITNASGDVRWGEALFDVADCLSGSFFNVFWDNGALEVAPMIRADIVAVDRGH